MPPKVRPLLAYRERTGQSHEELARLLSEKLKRPVTAAGVKNHENRYKLPEAWVEALGLDQPEPPAVKESFGPGEWASPAEEGLTPEFEPPVAPSGASKAAIPMQAPPAAGEYGLVRERISKAYAAIGAGMTMVTRNDGYGVAFDTYKDELAKAWTDAAKENKNVARIVEFMESGGVVGELVVAHLILMGGLVYVSGRAPALGSIYGRKLEPYHGAAAERRRFEALAEEAEPGGGAANGAAGAVGEARAGAAL